MLLFSNSLLHLFAFCLYKNFFGLTYCCPSCVVYFYVFAVNLLLPWFRYCNFTCKQSGIQPPRLVQFTSLVLQVAASPNFNVFRIDWLVLWWSYRYLLAALLCFLHRLPEIFRIKFKICLLTYKILCEKMACLSSLHACHITPIPFTEIKQRDPSVGSNAGTGAFHSCTLFGTTSHYLSIPKT